MKRFTTSERLKQIMKERNLKQADIMRLSEPYQKQLGISMTKSHLSQYVNAKFVPDNDRNQLLAQTLGVTEAWLMGFDVPMDIPILHAEIISVYEQLSVANQEEVVSFALERLKEQKKSLEPSN